MQWAIRPLNWFKLAIILVNGYGQSSHLNIPKIFERRILISGLSLPCRIRRFGQCLLVVSVHFDFEVADCEWNKGERTGLGRKDQTKPLALFIWALFICPFVMSLRNFNFKARVGFASFDDGVVAGDEFLESVTALAAVEAGPFEHVGN